MENLESCKIKLLNDEIGIIFCDSESPFIHKTGYSCAYCTEHTNSTTCPISLICSCDM